MYWVSAAGIAPIRSHSVCVWIFRIFCFASLFRFVCQLHILVALQWHDIWMHSRLYATFSVSLSHFLVRFSFPMCSVERCFSIANRIFFLHSAVFCLTISKFIEFFSVIIVAVVVVRSNQFFAPQFAKHNDRSWIWCVMRFPSHILLYTNRRQQQTKNWIVFSLSSFLYVNSSTQCCQNQPIYPLNVELFSIGCMLLLLFRSI